jgi:hypothetical protein
MPADFPAQIFFSTDFLFWLSAAARGGLGLAVVILCFLISQSRHRFLLHPGISVCDFSLIFVLRVTLEPCCLLLLLTPSSGFGPVSSMPPGCLLRFDRGSDRICFLVFARSSVRAPRSSPCWHFSLLLLISGVFFFRFRCPIFISSYRESWPRARQSQFLKSARLHGLQFDAECPHLSRFWSLVSPALRISVSRSGIR